MNSPPDWRDVFCGREEELKQLVNAYEAVAEGSGPRLAVVCADRGMGKTRLVQELYRHLATACDPDDYWPDASLFKGNNLRVAPDFADAATRAHFASFTTAERPMPFLWWGLRLNDPEDRNAVRTDMAGHRRTLDPHLERALFAREHTAKRATVKHTAKDTAKDAALKIAEALLESVPGIGLGKNLIEVGVGVFKTARSHVEARRLEGEFACADISALEEKRSDDIYERTVDDLEAVLAPAPGSTRVPAVVFCDDAQFARDGGDEGALRFLEKLWKRAEEGQWPLLVVATHWEVDWQQDRLADGKSFAKLFQHAASDLETSTIVHFPKQSNLGAMIEQGLPGLPREDVELLLRKVDGNPQVLIELVGLIQRSPGWRPRQGALSAAGRKSIEKHSCNLTKLITDRLLSDATPPGVRLAVALSSLQGMQFLSALTEAAAEAMELGSTRSGLSAASDPMRLIVGLDAGVASFVQRAYRDAAESLVENELGDRETVVAAVLDAAIALVDGRDDLEESSTLPADMQRALLGVVAALGGDSTKPSIRLRAGHALLELIDLAGEKADRASHAREFEAGLGAKWAPTDFTIAQLRQVRQALGKWYGFGRTVELSELIVDKARGLFDAQSLTAQSSPLESALRSAADAHECRGAYKASFEKHLELIDIARKRLATCTTTSNLDALCKVLDAVANIASSAVQSASLELELRREVVSIRRTQRAGAAAPHNITALVEALEALFYSGRLEDDIDALREVVELRRATAVEAGTEIDWRAASEALEALGDALDKLQRPLEAKSAYDQALEMSRKILRDWPTAQNGDELANQLDWVGQMFGHAGEFISQRAAWLEAVEVRAKLHDLPHNEDALLRLYAQLAHHCATCGEWDLAREYCLREEELTRSLGHLEAIGNLRTELAASAPEGIEWLRVEELQSERDATVAAKEQRLDELRAQYEDPASRTAALCNEMALELKRSVGTSIDAKRWDAAEVSAAECASVEGWARANGLHQGRYTDADCLEQLCWAFSQAKRWDQAMRVAGAMLDLRRQQARTNGSEDELANALLEATEIAKQHGDWKAATRLALECLEVHRRAVARDNGSHRVDELLAPLQEVAACAEHNKDWLTYESVQQECLSLGRLLWDAHGSYDELVTAACCLIENAPRRGDDKSLPSHASLVRQVLRDLRAQQGIDNDFMHVVRTLASAGSVLELMNGPVGKELRSEISRAIAEFCAQCRDLAKLQNVAVSLRDAGWLEDAELLQRKSLDLAVSTHGADSPEAASGYSALGKLLQVKGESTDAHRLYRKALVIREREFGADSKAAALVRDRIKELHEISS